MLAVKYVQQKECPGGVDINPLGESDVLDTFILFNFTLFRETVESSVCRRAIERLYNKVSDHLIETVTV